MNQLNESLMRVRVQIKAEEMQPRPDIQRLKQLRQQEKQYLEQLLK